MDKQEFLEAVEKEIILIKKHAKKENLKDLNIDLLDSSNSQHCIYGQITGDCRSLEAKRLMNLCCKKIFVVDAGVQDLMGKKFSKVKEFLDEKYNGQTWDESPEEVIDGVKCLTRTYSYLSVLEGYLCLKNAKIKKVFDFLEGKSKNLNL